MAKASVVSASSDSAVVCPDILRHRYSTVAVAVVDRDETAFMKNHLTIDGTAACCLLSDKFIMLRALERDDKLGNAAVV